MCFFTNQVPCMISVWAGKLSSSISQFAGTHKKYNSISTNLVTNPYVSALYKLFSDTSYFIFAYQVLCTHSIYARTLSSTSPNLLVPAKKNENLHELKFDNMNPYLLA